MYFCYLNVTMSHISINNFMQYGFFDKFNKDLCTDNTFF